jgi:hypothetical protein
MASEDHSAPGTQVGYGNPPARTRFQKGQSGNPGGQPKRKHFSGIADALKQALEEPCDTVAPPATRFEALARAIVQQAADDPRTLKLLLAHLQQ